MHCYTHLVELLHIEILKGGFALSTDNMQQGSASDKRVYCVDEIAAILGISTSSAYELVKKGCFKTVRIGTAIRISKKSFDDWLDSQITD